MSRVRDTVDRWNGTCRGVRVSRTCTRSAFVQASYTSSIPVYIGRAISVKTQKSTLYLVVGFQEVPMLVKLLETVLLHLSDPGSFVQ